MALSVIRVISLASRQIEILFSDDLDTNISIANISVTSFEDSISDSTVTAVSVEDDVLTVEFRPLFPKAQYKITFSSTSSQSFQTVNGAAIIENDSRNVLLITGPGEETNQIRDDMLEAVPVVYESEQPSLIRDLVSSTADQLQKASDVIDTVEAANYISVLEENESKTRGSGPTDKFNNGGAYEVLRVSSTAQAVNRARLIEFNASRKNDFKVKSGTVVNTIVEKIPTDPISLQFVDVVSETVSSDSDDPSFFDGLRITVSKAPVSQVISVTLKRDGVRYNYDIENYGYTILDNRYDTATASKNVNLANNEIDLSPSSITGESGAFVQPRSDDTIEISYVYKKLGRNVDPDSIEVSTVKQSVRELCPALLTSFSLDNAPIVLENDTIPSTGGVTFLNAVAVDGSAAFTVAHPAFTNEIEYDISKVPARPGDYSINYNTGEVLVFGDDTTGQGTGNSPPVASYYYRNVFVENLDYTFESDSDDLAVKSSGSIGDIDATIRFESEDVFAEGTDFKFLSHIESLNERVNNRLKSDFRIQTLEYPITDVFRVFNETTGEIYTIERFTDTDVIFSGRQAPVQKDVTRERANFERSLQETLFISDRTTNSSSISVFTINLENSGITDSQRNFIGASFDTSVLFSDTDIFINERFYEGELNSSTVTTNINKLTSVGEYMIDYTNGIVYVAVSSTQDSDLGDITYEHNNVETKNDHILRIENIYRSASSLEDNITNFNVGTITDTTSNIQNLDPIGERFLNGNPNRPLLVGSYQSGEDGVTVSGSNLFTSNSAIFTEDDIGRTLRLGANESPPSEDVTIAGIVNTHQVTISPVSSSTASGRVWNILDLSGGADKTITLENNIVSIRDIYTVTQLGTKITANLDGYFDINRDSFENNVITLGDANPLSVGEAIVVVYNYGNVFVDYRYLRDELLVSYEYGNNSLDWSISDALDEGDEYFVTYRYGALRDPLLDNFGALTQIPLLTNFPAGFDREVYRSIVKGTLQSFIKGPTIPSIKELVEAFTDVEPDITESVFDNWIVGRDYLYLRDPDLKNDAEYDLGKFGNGLLVNDDQTVKVPALAHFPLKEGTFSSWIRPSWDGIDNDADVTFDLSIDGYNRVGDVYIGLSGQNPETMPFTLNKDVDDYVLGEPINIGTDTGYFIWFDTFNDRWNIRWRENSRELHDFSGTISTSGEFYKVIKPTLDGYSINELSDLITSSTTSIEFDAHIDCLDSVAAGDAYGGAIGSIDGGPFTGYVLSGAVIDGGSFLDTVFYCTIDGGSFVETSFTPNLTESVPAAIYALDGITFGAGEEHYVFDLGTELDRNRISLYKDGTGYLAFRVFDKGGPGVEDSGRYILSTDVSDWLKNELHHVAVSWNFNTADDMDNMHLFVDGQEVPNLLIYGGRPSVGADSKYADVAEETVISSSSVVTVGSDDGSSIDGSALFRSSDVEFNSLEISIGDTLTILDDIPDGTQDPVTGGVYTITGLGENSVTLDRTLTSTLGSISFSVNQQTSLVETNINFQDFIVVTIDGYGNETELAGIDAETPDYSVARADFGKHRIYINDGVDIGDEVAIRPLGLNFRRCKGSVFVYADGDNKLRINGPYPVSLQDIDITKILMERTLIKDGSLFNLTSGALFASFGGDGYVSQLADGYVNVDGYICQPSNSITGRRLDVTLSGSNIDYSGNDNTIIINGDTPEGTGITETFTFTENDRKTSSRYWININTITMNIVPIDINEPAGTVEIRENKPLNEPDNHGNFAEISDFQNGIVTLEIYGSGEVPFNLESCWYEVDYPSFLKIDITNIPDNFYLGSDVLGDNQFNGVIDELKITKTARTDTRVGETITAVSITNDYNATLPDSKSNDMLLLLHFDDTLDNEADYIDSFDEGFEVSDSVNSEFGSSLLISGNRPYEVNNALGVFNNDAGTIEFWVSPLQDNDGDPNLHYYFDITSQVVEEFESTNTSTIVLDRRARSVESVRLLTDTNNTGLNYFSGGGTISSSDNKTITLGIPLPSSNTQVKVAFTPLSQQGDRVSIYKDDAGFVNFFVKASGEEHLISSPVDWNRHTWHRIMATWDFNNSDGQDRIRLFVDGNERGVIKYGTGLIYGTGILYGQAEIRSGQNRFLTDNIDLTDTFARIFIGTDFQSVNSGKARFDNIRFSNIVRTGSITTVGGESVDVTYNSNIALALPVTEDLYTTLLLDFDKDINVVEFFATLINPSKGIFRFNVDVIDSFDKIKGNTVLEKLVEDLINVIKPAHTEATVDIKE